MTLNAGYAYRETLGVTARGHTALSHLAAHHPHSSEAEWLARLEAGEVTLDGRPAQALERLRPGQVLVWHRPPWQEMDVPRRFALLFEDRALLVVNKPSGLPTLPGAGFLENTLLSVVRERFPEAVPLHRLGRATSGLVLFARSRGVAARLSGGWSGVDKRYLALASGVAAEDRYDIQTPIGPVAHPRLGQVHAARSGGKPARSVATVLERREQTTLFEVRIFSGRPHQIRVHLASIGHPLEGDPLYGVGGLPLATLPGLPGDAGYRLHAWQLRFEHPDSGAALSLEAEPPEILALERVKSVG